MYSHIIVTFLFSSLHVIASINRHMISIFLTVFQEDDPTHYLYLPTLSESPCKKKLDMNILIVWKKLKKHNAFK